MTTSDPTVSADAGPREISLGPGRPTLHAVVRPGPRPVVFVHGFAASGAYFHEAPARPELAGRGVVVLDLPGFGRTPAPAGFGFTMGEQAGVVAAAADALDLEDVTLVGHSMGGTIAVLAAGPLGARLRELVLVEAILQHEPLAWTTAIAAMAPDEWAAELERLRRRPLMFARGSMVRRRPEAIQHVAPAITQTTAAATHLSARSLRDTAADPALYERFRALTVPALYLFGDRNLDVAFYERLRGDQEPIEVIPHAGHLMMLDNPAGFYRVVAAGAPPATRA